MTEFLEIFNELYTKVEIMPEITLSDKEKIIFGKIFEKHNVLKHSVLEMECYEKHINYEDFHKIYKSGRKYTVCEVHRASEYPCFKKKSVEYAAVILFLLISRYYVKTSDLQKALEDKVAYEVENENLDTAKELLQENFGNLISFGENVYDKLSICPAKMKNKMGVYYHKKWIYWHGPTDNIGKIYNFVCRYCVSIKKFRKFLSKIGQIVPVNDAVENSKLEFLFVSGKNEDQIT